MSGGSDKRRCTAGIEAGFTLVELTVVLVIIALATAIVVPALWRSVGKAELRTSARSVAALFQLARSRAAVTSKAQFVNVNLERGESRLFPATSDEKDDGVGEVYRLPRNVRFKSVEMMETPDLTEQSPEGLIELKEEELEEYELEFAPHGIAKGAKVVLEDVRGRAFTVKVEPGSGIISVLEGEEEDDE